MSAHRGLRRRSSVVRTDPLSRNERERVFGTESRPTPIQRSIRCGSCRDRELTEDVRLGTAKRDFVIFPTCEECGGTGMVPAYGKHRYDPYLTPRAIFG